MLTTPPRCRGRTIMRTRIRERLGGLRFSVPLVAVAALVVACAAPSARNANATASPAAVDRPTGPRATALTSTVPVSSAPPSGGSTAAAAAATDRASNAQSYPPDLPRVIGVASWELESTFDAVVEKADLFVVGEVIAVQPGREVAETPTQSLPFTNSQIRVTDVGKGVPRDDEITVEQTGGVYRPTHAIEDSKLPVAPLPPDAPSGVAPLSPAAPPSKVLLELEDDPLFRVGQQVALALMWKPELNVYQIVNPQGRFAVRDDGTVQPILGDDPAVKDLAGATVEDLLQRVSAAATR